MIAITLLVLMVGLVVWGLERNHRRNDVPRPYGVAEAWGSGVARRWT